jgi:hypothetical protein
MITKRWSLTDLSAPLVNVARRSHSAPPTNKGWTKKPIETRNKHSYNRIRMIINSNGSIYIPRNKGVPIHRMKIRDFSTDKYTRCKRAGIIVYTTIHNAEGNPQILFGMGVDSATREITDFGGGVTFKDKTVVDAAIREFQEETLGSFGPIKAKDLDNCPALWCENMMIIMVPFELKHCYNASSYFQNRRMQLVASEVDDIEWLTREELEILIHGGLVRGRKMYDRVRKLLSGAANFYPILC